RDFHVTGVQTCALPILAVGEDEAALWVRCADDTEALRRAVAERGLVAFIADGSTLPRRSGVDRRPLEGGVPFTAPESMAVRIDQIGRASCRESGWIAVG